MKKEVKQMVTKGKNSPRIKYSLFFKISTKAKEVALRSWWTKGWQNILFCIKIWPSVNSLGLFPWQRETTDWWTATDGEGHKYLVGIRELSQYRTFTVGHVPVASLNAMSCQWSRSRSLRLLWGVEALQAERTLHPRDVNSLTCTWTGCSRALQKRTA